jgi:hypothetical protein
MIQNQENHCSKLQQGKSMDKLAYAEGVKILRDY